MLHAREDYNRRIQDNANLIPKDEPVFLLRAQDTCALMTLQSYLETVEGSREPDPSIVLGVRRQINRFLTWRKEHGSKMPDMKAEDVV